MKGDPLPTSLDVGDRGPVQAGQAPEGVLTEMGASPGETDPSAELRVEVLHVVILTARFQKCHSNQLMFATVTS